MDAIPDALERLFDDLVAWMRTPSERMMVVVTPASLRERVLTLLELAEHHRANVSPFVVTEAEHVGPDGGWAARTGELRAAHQRRREAAGDEVLPALSETAVASTPTGRFATMLASLLAVTPPGASGLVCVLAPRRVRNGEAWLSAVERLVDAAGLGAVRWLMVDVETDISAGLVGRVAGRVHRVLLPADYALALIDELAAEGPPGARSPASPPVHPSEARGGEPADAPPGADASAQIRVSVLQAIAAVARGDLTAAVVRQARAVASCQAEGATSASVTLQTMLGSLLLAGGSPARALEALQGAATDAAELGRPDQAALARLAMGCARQVRGDRHGALVDHAEATVLAEKAGPSPLAVEAARSTGQLAADLGLETQAVAFLAKAVTLSEAAPLAALGSGPLAARRLAELCRRRGLLARATELEAQAEALAHTPLRDVEAEPPPPSTPVEPAPRTADLPTLPEGTALMPLEEIASIHGWSQADVERIHRVTEEVLDDRGTSMLTSAELEALAAGGPLLVSPVVVAPPPLLVLEPPAEPAMVTPEAPREEEALDPLAAALARMQTLRDVVIEDELGGETRHHDRADLERLVHPPDEDEDPDRGRS